MSTRRIVLLAHNIRSLWNVGSFFRCADAFQVEHIYLTGYTSAPPRKEISKTAIGADAWIPWSRYTDPKELIVKLKNESFYILSLELSKDSVPLPKLSVPTEMPVCIIVGHEILGVPDELLSLSDAVTSIPMLGKKNSLNVSVACGVALYALRCC